MRSRHVGKKITVYLTAIDSWLTVRVLKVRRELGDWYYVAEEKDGTQWEFSPSDVGAKLLPPARRVKRPLKLVLLRPPGKKKD